MNKQKNKININETLMIVMIIHVKLQVFIFIADLYLKIFNAIFLIVYIGLFKQEKLVLFDINVDF